MNEPQDGTAPAAFTVSLTPSAGAVSVDYATADASARAQGDYQAASGTVSFAPGASTKVVTVAVAADDVYEGDESFALVLSNPTGAVLADAGLCSVPRSEAGTWPARPPCSSA